MDNKEILKSIQSSDVEETKNLFKAFLDNTNDHINDSKTPLEILYHIDDIREAVDIVIGDDGFRSKEVVEILKTGIGGKK